MNLLLGNKVALVIGSSAGIGYSIAKSLAEEGANVILVSRNEAKLENAAQKIRENTNQEIRHITFDISEHSKIPSLIQEALELFGRIDILINNASGPAPGTLEATTSHDWQAGWSLTLMSVVEATKAVLPIMQRNQWGRIISITSILSEEPSAGMVISATYRAGVAAFNKAVAGQVAAEGITINTVLPSAVLTDRANYLIGLQAESDDITFEAALERAQSNLPMKRFSSGEEIGSLVTYLCSEQAAYISGLTHKIDGCLSKGL
ncbi:SDR family NAD(P)-dependent oxidoreductase [Kiloniella laminariae]|uniref:SDR family NAD(P)-dependent oxidoreductase n=1 Tax=Kiloniella laminariae TaxID=454162 RepID=UPI000367C46A|nr:SDR family NAD(P)-dependent oxidoreductase [Kiloniella laminariae]